MAFGPANETLVVNIVLRSDADVVIKRVNSQVQGLANQTKQSLSGANRAFTTLGSAARGFGRTLQALTAPLGAFNRRWTALGVTIGTTLATFKAVSDAQKFGIAIAEISTIFDDTLLPLAQVEERLLSLSESLGIVETVAAKGFYQIISSDITDAAEAMIVLEESAKLATAGLADIKGTIDVVTSVIKAYQKDVAESAEITDILFRTVQKGKTTIPELSTSLGQVLPIAATLGVEFRQVTAAIATLTQGGIETNTAVIQLRQAFNQLLKPSVEASKVLAQYNIDISQSAVRNKQLSGVLAELREKLGTNAVAYAKIFGNIRGLLPIIALADKQFEQFNKNLAAIEDSEGAVAGALERLFESPFKRIQVFINAVRIRLRGIGEVFIKTLDDALGGREGIARAVETLDTAFNLLKGVAFELAEAIGAIVDEATELIERLDAAGGAGQAFRKLGELMGSTLALVLRTVAAITVAIAELAAQLPALVQALVRELKKVLNALDPVPFRQIFDVERTRDEVTAAIEETGDQIVRVRERLAKKLEAIGSSERILFSVDTGELRDAQKVIDDLELMARFRQTGVRLPIPERRGELFGDIRQLEVLTDGLEGLQSELRTAPNSVNDIVLSLESAVGPLRLVAEGVDNLKTAWGELDDTLGVREDPFSPLTESAKKALKAFEDLPRFADEEGSIDTLIAERMQQARLAVEEGRAALALELSSIEQLFGDLDIEMPFTLTPEIREVRDVEAVEEARNALRQVLEDEFRVTVPLTVGEENLADFVARATEAVDTISALREASARTIQDELGLLDAGLRLRRAQLALTLRQVGASEELTAEAFRAFDAAEVARRQAVVGFEDAEQFFDRLAGKAELPFELQAAAIDRGTRKLGEQLDAAVRLGFVAERLRPAFETALDANRAQQFAAALDFDGVREEVEAFGRSVNLALGDQVRIAQEIAREERERIERIIETQDLTEAQVGLLLRIRDLVEGAKIDEVLDFTTVTAELEEIRSAVEPTFRELVRVEEDRFAIALERARLLREVNRITEDELGSIQAAVGLERERLRLEQARALLGDPVFERPNFTENAFQGFRTDAIQEVLGELEEIPKRGSEAWRKLQADYDRALGDMLRNGKAFTAGFGAALADLAREFGNAFEIGAQAAREAVFSVRDAVSAGIQELILFKEEGEDTSRQILLAFRETLARGLAKAVADAFTNLTLGALLKPLEALGGPSREEEAIQAIADRLKDTQAEIASAAQEQFAGAVQILQGPADELLAAGISLKEAAAFIRAPAEEAAAAAGAAGGTAAAEGAAEGAVQGAAGAATEGVIDMTALTTALTTSINTAFSPVIAGLSTAGLKLDVAGGFLRTAAGFLGEAAFALDAAAVKLAASSVTPGATGGIFPSFSNIEAPTVRFGSGGIMRPIEKLGMGGVKLKRTFAEVAEAGQPEAVVPLPGAGRAIPVDFTNPEALGRGGTTVQMTVVMSPSFQFQNLDPRSTQEIVAKQVPGIMKMFTAALDGGRNRNLEKAIQRVARRGS